MFGFKWVNVVVCFGIFFYVNLVGGVNDELYVFVIDVDGKIIGNFGFVFECFIGVFKVFDVKIFIGEVNYYKEVIK